MRSRDRKLALELQFGARLSGASQPLESPTTQTVIEHVPAGLAPVKQAEQVPTVREAIREINGMVGKQMMVIVRDTETGYAPFDTVGVLSKLIYTEEEWILSIDGIEGGIVFSPEHYTGGEVENNSVIARFGSLMLEITGCGEVA